MLIYIGRINRHKNGPPSRPQPWNKLVSSTNDENSKPHRVAPYPQPPSKRAKPSASRHRTLVINNSGNTSSADDDINHFQPNGWVTKRDRHMQLINTNILDKETRARSKAMEETRRQKAMARDRKEKKKMHTFLQAKTKPTTHASDTSTVHEIIIDGLRFQVLNGGSKLARTRGECLPEISCPARLKIIRQHRHGHINPKTSQCWRCCLSA